MVTPHGPMTSEASGTPLDQSAVVDFHYPITWLAIVGEDYHVSNVFFKILFENFKNNLNVLI